MRGKEAFNHGVGGFPSRLKSERSEVALKTPPLFQGIGRVYVATHNLNKLGAVTRWVDSKKVVWGSNFLSVTDLVPGGGEEPDWSDALRVALHKTDAVVDQVRQGRKAGPEALVIGSDVVVWMNNKPSHNLSREKELTGGMLQEEVAQLRRMFGKPSVVVWDVAVAVSRRGLRAATGNRIAVAFEPINGELIEEIFAEDIGGALGRNTRLPLIDDPRLTQHIIGARVIPLRSLVDNGGSLADWHLSGDFFTDPKYFERFPVTAWQLDMYRQEIVGGLPINGSLDRLEELEVGSKTVRDLVVV